MVSSLCLNIFILSFWVQCTVLQALDIQVAGEPSRSLGVVHTKTFKCALKTQSFHWKHLKTCAGRGRKSCGVHAPLVMGTGGHLSPRM